MEEQALKFEEKLKTLVALGKKKKNVLEVQEINEVFSDMALEEEQMEKIYEYLEAQNVDVLRITEEVEKLNGEKNLLKERSKTTKEENELKEEIRLILEKRHIKECVSITIKSPCYYPRLFYNDSGNFSTQIFIDAFYEINAGFIIGNIYRYHFIINL